MQAQDWLPRYGDSYWRDSIPETMRQSYIKFGEQYIKKSWNSLPVSAFAEYRKIGNRSHYESLLFEKRRQFAALVMAEIVEMKGRFLSDIINGINSTLDETWWGLPAHYNYEEPRADFQYVDIFNAETGSLVAYTRYMFSDVIDVYSPFLTRRIDSEICRRILKPTAGNKYWWKYATNNWNPWICSNWLACVLFCEHDESLKKEAIKQINKACEVFYNAYPADGGCNEGPHYWNRAAASLFEVCYLLTMSKNESKVHLYDSKLKKMGSYIYAMYAGNGYEINFADTHGYRAFLNVNIAYPYGLMTGDKMLCQYAAWMGQKNEEIHNPVKLFNKSGNWPSLGRELIFLLHIQTFLKEQPCEPIIKEVWLPDLQIMTARTSSTSPLFVAYKGGNNGESHNHNDVGSFIVYSKEGPLLIDLGVGEYTAKTFSDNRYEIWTMQSDYHNLPRINGYSQNEGVQYHAKVINNREGFLTLDISNAYPKNAKVDKWYRTVSTRSRNKIDVTEDFLLTSYEGVTQLMFITPIEPRIFKKGMITLEGSCIVYNSSQLKPHIEDISSKLDSVMKRIWGQHLYRIILEVSSKSLKQRIKYSITLE